MYPKSSDSFTFFIPPYIVFGAGKRSTLPSYATKLKMQKALLVADPFFAGTGHIVAMREGLADAGVETVLWTGVVPDPTDVSVDDAVNSYREQDCDGVIAVGGGSGMDTGKSAAVVIGSGSESIREHMKPVHRQVTGMAPTICLPTTSGTGAEANPYTMVTQTELSLKTIGFDAWTMLSAQDVAIVDPELTVSMPPGLTAVTGFDAFCQSLECYVTKRPNPVSDDLALRSISLVADNLRQAVYDGQDIAARSGMSFAALLSTMSFPNAGLSYPHNLSTTLADLYHLQHGVAVATILVAALESLLPFRTERLSRVASVMGVPQEGLSPREHAASGIKAIELLMNDVGLPTLTKACEGKADCDEVMEYFLSISPNVSNTPGEAERIRWVVNRSLEW